MTQDYRVLLYYKYQTIEDGEAFKEAHLKFGKSIGLKGRIIVADEGINGTVSGPVEVTEQYKDYLHSLPGFEDVWFKEDVVDDYAHSKMFVRYRPEIVALHLEDDLDPRQLTGDYLSPKEFKSAIEADDVIVLDTRNDYEYELGHFEGAINPNIRSFRELPQWVRDNKELFMDKKVAVYCTGGVRCEKFSGWLLREGAAQVGQLHGGIDTYGKDPEVKGEHWNGKMYVFDERIDVPINHVNPSVIGRDWYDNSPYERYVNCANPDCNRQFFSTEENEDKYMRSCSLECFDHPRNRYAKEYNLSKGEVEALRVDAEEVLADKAPQTAIF